MSTHQSIIDALAASELAGINRRHAITSADVAAYLAHGSDAGEVCMDERVIRAVREADVTGDTAGILAALKDAVISLTRNEVDQAKYRLREPSAPRYATQLDLDHGVRSLFAGSHL